MGTVPIPRQEIVLKVARPWPALGGVFLRPAARRRGDVWQAGGSAFCGYDDGRFKDRLRDDDTAHRRDRAFEFRLDDGVSSSVWFGGSS